MKKNTFLKSTITLLSLLMLVGCNKTNTSASGNPSNDVNNTQTTNSEGNKTTDTETSKPSDKTVSKIVVSKEPTKMNYVLNEEFSPEGGEITATYSDKSTEVISMSDERVTIVKPNTKTTGSKVVKVTFGGKSVTFKIKVTKAIFAITFITNGGSDVASLNVEKGKKITKPADPTKEGFNFDGWYTDSELTLAYDFETEVDGALTLYAKWLQKGKAVFNVTFDYGFYGSVPQKRVLHVASGEKAVKVSVDPSRKGYVFQGWNLNGSAFDFSSPITSDVVLKASYKSSGEFDGEHTFVFEAEDVSFDGIVGKGLSGTATETACIVKDENVKASNDRFVSFLYQYGLGIKFDVTCDKAVSNVNFVARLSQYIEDFTYTKDMWTVKVNDQQINYNPIEFKGVPAMVNSTATPLPFADFSLGNISLKEGHNTISLMTTNNIKITGTTMEAHCPLIDAIKFTASDFVMDWDATLGYPFSNY